METGENQRLTRLERQVDFLFRQLGLDPDVAADSEASLPSSFYAALGRGKTIEAIKIYREVTGVGLAQAKKDVEAIARQAGS